MPILQLIFGEGGAIDRFGPLIVVIGLFAIGVFLLLTNMSAARKNRSESEDRLEERKMDLTENLRQDLRDKDDQLTRERARYEEDRRGNQEVLRLLTIQGDDLKVWQRDLDLRLSAFMRSLHQGLGEIRDAILSNIPPKDSP